MEETISLGGRGIDTNCPSGIIVDGIHMGLEGEPPIQVSHIHFGPPQK